MNLVIVEDSELVRMQLLRLIAHQPAIRVVATASGEEEAIAAIDATRPDAVLLDLSLAPGSGINVLKRMRASGSAARVLVLTNNTYDAVRRICEQHGIDGFYDKSSEAEHCLAQLISWLPQAGGSPR